MRRPARTPRLPACSLSCLESEVVGRPSLLVDLLKYSEAIYSRSTVHRWLGCVSGEPVHHSSEKSPGKTTGGSCSIVPDTALQDLATLKY
jgi:hypothetical protein